MTCLARLGLLGTVLALRSHTPDKDSADSSCPTAEQRKGQENIFEISASIFQDDTVWQEWRLYRSPNCTSVVGVATILPILDASDPEAKSKVSISIEDSMKGDLYLCNQRGTKCTVHVRPPEETWMLVDLLQKVVPKHIRKGFHSLRPELAVLYELVVLFSCCIVVMIIFWSMGLLMERCKEREQQHWGLVSTSDVSSKHFRLPSTTEIISQGFVDVLFFVIGCGIFVLEGERFFRIYHDAAGLGFALVIVFPLLFGCAALMRIFLATSRVHLYYESLRSGMLLKLKPVTFLRDPLLMWFWLGVTITVGYAAQAVFGAPSHWIDDLKALVVFISPLYYMTSSLLDMRFAEGTAVRQHCTLALEGISKEKPITLGADNSIEQVEESTFVHLARQRKTIQPNGPAEEAAQANSSLSILDFQWVGFVSLQRAEGLNRILLRFFNPQLICALLCLGLFSFVVSFKTMIATPHLQQLSVIGARLSKDFSPSRTEYALLVHSSQHLTGVSAKVNPSETSLLSFRSTTMDHREVTTTAGLAEAISLDEDVYPADVTLEVRDTFRTTDYRLQVFKYGILPESLILSGEHKNGHSFKRCVPWGYIARNPYVRVPPNLINLEVSINYAHFVVDLPAGMPEGNRFTTLFEKNVSKAACLDKPQTQQYVVISQFSASGCYSVMQPKWNTCGATRGDLTKDFMKQVAGTVSGDLCTAVHGQSWKDGSCVKLNDSGHSQLLGKLTHIEEGKSPWWEESEMELRLDLSFDSSQLSLLDPKSNVAEGFWITAKPHEVEDLFHISLLSGSTLVPETKNLGRLQDLLSDDFLDLEVTELGSSSASVAHTAFQLEDTPSLTTAEFLDIVFQSSDMDCYMESLKVDGGPDLELVKLNPSYCNRTWNYDAEACGGWQPTQNFGIPMKVFKDEVRKTFHQESVGRFLSTVVFTGHPVCRSLSNFQEEIPMQNISLSIRLKMKPRIKPIAWMPGHKVRADVYPCERRCEVDILNGQELKKTQDELLITIINEEPNCTLQDYGFQFGVRFVNKSKEACREVEALSKTKMCGGHLPSTTLALTWESTQEFFHNAFLLNHDIPFKLKCTNRIWSPYPLSVDVASYVDVESGNLMPRG